jgi:hypothetical protein
LLRLAILAVGATLLIAPGAVARSHPTAGSGVVGSGPIANSQSAAAYWTPARMASAKPATPIVSGQPQPGVAPDVSGPAVSVPPAAAGNAANEPAGLVPLAAQAVPRPYTNYPDKVNGKVFFTKATGGNFVCSGTAVNSENKSIVWTAGHCVHNGNGGAFHRNWTFVPAYSSSFNGQRPFGTWTARELWTRGEWASHGDLRQDFGAVVVNRINNVRLVNAIGGDGITFNQSRNQAWSSFGYPQAAPFNGFDQWRCNSGRLADDFPPGVGPATIKINCNMTGGSSGGGWLISIQPSGLGFVNGLNSYRYSNTPNNLFGPYFGNEGLSLFNTVRNRPA